MHSRAARRATSPSINTDKSLKTVKVPDTPAKLPVHRGAGVTKRKAKAKPLSRQQRLRQEKGLERAVAVMDQTERKVERSTRRGKTANERRVSAGFRSLQFLTCWALMVLRLQGAWEDVNGKAELHRKRSTKKRPVAGKENGQEDEWEEEGSDEEVADKVTRLKVGDVEGAGARTVEVRAKDPTEDEDTIT